MQLTKVDTPRWMRTNDFYDVRNLSNESILNLPHLQICSANLYAPTTRVHSQEKKSMVRVAKISTGAEYSCLSAAVYSFRLS